MQYEGVSMYMLAEVRHAELQAEVDQYISGRQEPGQVPSFGALIAAGWQRLQGLRLSVSSMIRQRSRPAAPAASPSIAKAGRAGVSALTQ